jgi:hypothetical protein
VIPRELVGYERRPVVGRSENVLPRYSKPCGDRYTNAVDFQEAFMVFCDTSGNWHREPDDPNALPPPRWLRGHIDPSALHRSP